MRFKKLVDFIWVALLLVSCNSSNNPAITNSQEPPIVSTTTATARSTAKPTFTPTLRPIPTYTEKPITCPKIGQPQPVTFPNPVTGAQLKRVILGYLNSGGEPRGLPDLLEETKPTKADLKLQLTPIDINGDAIEELIVAAELWSSKDYYHESAIWEFECTRTGKYKLGTGFFDYYFFNPRIFAVEDLNGDKLPEVVTIADWGGSFCELSVDIISWSEGKGIDYFFKRTPNCPATISLDDRNKDGLKEIILNGETSSSIAGGVSRKVIYIYSWYKAGYELIEIDYAYSPVRIHVIEDAQRAFDKGDLELAKELYSQAAYDESLKNVSAFPWGDPKFIDTPEKYQPAFALFRLAVLELVQGNISEFDNTLSDLDTLYPTGTPGSEFADATRRFEEEWTTNADTIIACGQTDFYINQTYPALVTHIGYWGLNNISYMGDFCPFQDK